MTKARYRDSAVSIVTWLWAGRPRVRILIEARNFIFLQTHPDGHWKRHSRLYPHPRRSEVKNEWNYTSIPLLCLHVILRCDLHLWKSVNVYWSVSRHFPEAAAAISVTNYVPTYIINLFYSCKMVFLEKLIVPQLAKIKKSSQVIVQKG
jgi:hypothetical protein